MPAFLFCYKKLPLIHQADNMRKGFLILLFFTSFLSAQSDSTVVDHKYLEDQVYFNLSYIQLMNLPNEISQSGFSFGLYGGFIKDFPLNPKRNIGFGLGLGYGFSNFYFDVNLPAAEPVDTEPITIKNNKILLHKVEFPVELRFRNSTATRYKFWRFYPGIKFAYVFAQNTSFGKSLDYNDDIIDVNDFIYGLTFSVGYNKWNLQFYYGLNDLFTNNINNDNDIQINDFRIGLIFYIF